MKYDASKIKWRRNKGELIWWGSTPEPKLNEYIFSFDKKKVYNIFPDYPKNLTPEEKAIFDKENPYCAEFRGKI